MLQKKQSFARSVPVNRCNIDKLKAFLEDGMRHEKTLPGFVCTPEQPSSYSLGFRVVLNPEIHIAVTVIHLGFPSVEPNLPERDFRGQAHAVKKPLEISIVFIAHPCRLLYSEPKSCLSPYKSESAHCLLKRFDDYDTAQPGSAMDPSKKTLHRQIGERLRNACKR